MSSGCFGNRRPDRLCAARVVHVPHVGLTLTDGSSRHAINMRREAILCNRAQSLRQQASMNRTDIIYPPFPPIVPETQLNVFPCH
jgi:hypothetical protein